MAFKGQDVGSRDSLLIPLRTALAYAIFAGIWILFSDKAVEALQLSYQWDVALQTYKGWAFVGVTAVLLYLVLRGQLGRLQRETLERKMAQERIARLNRVYAVLSATNKVIARERDPKTLFTQVRRIASALGGFRFPWFAELTGSPGPLSVSAHFGSPEPPLGNLQSVPEECLLGPGKMAEQLRAGQLVILNNIASDEKADAWREDAARLGCRALAVLPLIVDDELRGAFGLYAGEADCFDALELELLNGLREDLSFALEFAEKEARRKQAEQGLTRETLRTALLLDLYARASQMTDGELTRFALDQAVALTDSTIGFLHRVSEDQKEIILTAWNSEAFRHCKAACDGHYPVERAGNWADCMRLRQPVIYNDFANSPNQRGLPQGHLSLKRFVSIPVLEGDRIRLILGVGNREYEYTQEDVGHLQLVANELHKISVQRQAQGALRESERRFRDVAEAVGELIWEIDAAARFTYVSDRVQSMLGYRSEDMVGRPFWEFVIEADVERCEEHWRKLLQAPAGFRDFEICLKNRAGKCIWNSFGAVPVLDAEGVLTGFRGAAVDITERRQNEEQQRKLEAQLFQAQKMESVGRLAGGVAHDFNNMLSVITGNAEIALLQVPHTEPLYNDIEQIRNAAQRSADLVRQLLAFAREQTIRPQVLDLNSVIAGTLQMLRRLVGEDIDLVWRPGARLWKVKMDPTQIDQILANLAVNARDAIEGTGAITIQTASVVIDDSDFEDEPEMPAGEYVLLSIADTGGGITKEVMEHIFEPFFTTKELGKGTGLGLATVYGIVRQNKGIIQVSSEPGQGTIFMIYLPKAQADEDETQSVKEENELPQGGTETILLVEDDESVLTLGRKFLERLGYTVLAASSPSEALRTALEYPEIIHLLLTDVVMPEMSGRELAERVVAARPQIKCIYFSGYTADVIARQGVLFDGVRFVQKPFSINELAAEIREELGEPSAPSGNGSRVG